MTATNHSANQGRVPAQGAAQQMPTTAPAAAPAAHVQGAPVPAAGQTAHVQAAQAPAQQGQVLQAPHGQVPAQQRTPRRRVQAKQTFFSVFRSEWSKLASLRSTWITAAIASLITIGFSVALMAQYSGMKGYADKAANYLTVGSSFGQIAVAVLGALLITGEYSSGQIRSSLAAVPRRGRLFAAKAAAVTIFSALLGLVTVTGVDLTPDYAHATVHFSVLPDDDERVAETLRGLRAGGARRRQGEEAFLPARS